MNCQRCGLEIGGKCQICGASDRSGHHHDERVCIALLRTQLTEVRNLLTSMASLVNQDGEIWPEGSSISMAAAKHIEELIELKEKAFVLLGIKKSEERKSE